MLVDRISLGADNFLILIRITVTAEQSQRAHPRLDQTFLRDTEAEGQGQKAADPETCSVHFYGLKI